ncbi:DNA polymerase beta superfamily protein [[Kitasatospora] papulosa]|uniref:DNA polymerase beta superfamily protein n=1 Tax=[Kitasatospora] papulosa TaxID=1464011 RepID=UPI003685EAA8
MHMDTTLLRGAGLPDIDPARILGGEPCPLLFATVSGAHLYGFPSRDSDVDLRGVHVLPAEDLVGLRPPEETRPSLMEAKTEAEHGAAHLADRAAVARDVQALHTALDEAQAASRLAETPSGFDALHDLVVHARLGVPAVP